MIGSRAARRYAKAVLLQASDTNTAHVLFEDMQSVSATISNNSELKEMLYSPVYNDEDKKEALHKIFIKQTNKLKQCLIKRNVLKLSQVLFIYFNLIVSIFLVFISVSFIDWDIHFI